MSTDGLRPLTEKIGYGVEQSVNIELDGTPIMMHPATNRSVTALFAVAGVMLSSACSFDRPISRALTDMSFETRRQHGALFTHTELVSLNGLMPMPEAGLIYHYANKRFLLAPV